MKEIRNKTNAPIRIPLPGGKVLHLGPGKIAQIADKAVEHAGMKRLLEAESIEILGDGERVEGSSVTGGTSGQSQDRAKAPFRRRSGER